MCALLPSYEYCELGAKKHRANAVLEGPQHLMLSMFRCHFSLLPLGTREASEANTPK